jgi:hypothetical protein
MIENLDDPRGAEFISEPSVDPDRLRYWVARLEESPPPALTELQEQGVVALFKLRRS